MSTVLAQGAEVKHASDAQAAVSKGGAASPNVASRTTRRPLEPEEMRRKGVFRAMNRLLELGAQNEEHLWSTARIMSDEEFEQTAEERALVRVCGNPLCHNTCEGSHVGPCNGVRPTKPRTHPPEYCSTECAGAVKAFAARLGPPAAALHRFEMLMQQLKQPDQPAKPAPAAAEGGTPQAALGQPAAVQLSASAGGGAEPTAGVGTPVTSDQPVRSAPFSSSAAQFADFTSGHGPSSSNNAPLSRTSSGRMIGKPAGEKPKGVLKKQSQFAAGTEKVPIMLAEVKERDPSPVAPSVPGRGTRGAAAVEGYVPRARSEFVRQKQEAQPPPPDRQNSGRRVRWSDDVDRREERREQQLEAQSWGGSGEYSSSLYGLGGSWSAGPLSVPSRATPAPTWQTSPKASSHPAVFNDDVVFEDAAPAQPPAAAPSSLLSSVAAAADGSGGGAPAAGAAAPPAPVLVFELDDSQGPLEGGQQGLATSFGRLRVADSLEIGLQDGSLQQVLSDAPQWQTYTPPASRTSSYADVAMLGGSRTYSTADMTLLSGATSPPAAAMPSAAAAAAGVTAAATSGVAPKAAAATQRASKQEADAAPDASADAASEGSAAAGVEPAAAGATPEGTHQQEREPQQEQSGEEMLKLQQGLARAFPQLARTLPPELAAQLDSSFESEDEEEVPSEGWMDSEEEQEMLQGAGSSDDEEALLAPGTRSGFRLQLPFFGTLFTHLEAWVTEGSVQLLASEPSAEPPAAVQPSSPEVVAALSRFLSVALPPVAAALALAPPRNEVERSVHELLRTMRVLGPLPAFKASQWQVVLMLLLKALSLERVPALRPSFESRAGIKRVSRLLASLSFTIEEWYAALEVLCPVG